MAKHDGKRKAHLPNAETVSASSSLRKRYLLHRLQEIIRCRTALAEDNWDRLALAGEELCGNAETFGFSRLTRMGRALEKVSLLRTKKRAHRLLFQFEKEVAEELSKF